MIAYATMWFEHGFSDLVITINY